MLHIYHRVNKTEDFRASASWLSPPSNREDELCFEDIRLRSLPSPPPPKPPAAASDSHPVLPPQLADPPGGGLAHHRHPYPRALPPPMARRPSPTTTAVFVVDHNVPPLSEVLVPATAAYAVYRSYLQTVPYTHQRRAVVLPPRYERKLGEYVFALYKKPLLADGDDKILPPDHADTVRVRRIADEIIGAAQRALIAPRRNGELLDDESGVAESRRAPRGQPQPMAKHLEGLDGEVIVVRDKQINAGCLPGGKILVNTGFLEYIKTDDEITAVLGHEDGD
ncbi:uncharacterized protein LOC100832785 isoform X2 [Brachypodium distachyon]|uniref:uncharacterized protein LOC100832785 isoform X2 n=1 Tax=Brachypodium distachyon TaxID=15368 RepID=UPI000D0D744C|nr:uncharacterized protein LOC100832785 isoform X2 [Brachypodium distachyon]|eukprot:XP_024318189.1 uncharacterized protein LOC100832785 isoform X2 [Brachypodium distachyon]